MRTTLKTGDRVRFVGGRNADMPLALGAEGTVVDNYSDLPDYVANIGLSLIGAPLENNWPITVQFDGVTHATLGGDIRADWSMTSQEVEKVESDAEIDAELSNLLGGNK
jgi:hypothetical protein